MAQKKFTRRRSRPQLHTGGSRPQKRQVIHVLENDILRFLWGQGEPASMTDIARGVTGKRSLNTETKTAIAHLVRTKVLTKLGKKHYQIGPAAHLYQGTVHQHPKGFGFISVHEKFGNSKPLERDIFVSASKMGGAMHGDVALLRVHNISSSGRPEGTILSVLERGPNTVAGFFSRGRKGDVVYPEDSRYPFIIKVPTDEYTDLENGMAVIVSFTPPEQPSRFINGKIIEVLGSPDNIDVQMRLVIEKYKLPYQFSEETLVETEAIPEALPHDEGREDLRNIQHVTIDGETAKDFDDAICVLKKDDGYRLYVSIADVSHYVKSGSAIDKDAYQRGTSIYFPGRVIPMLPEKLSNNLCSLVPDTDRLAVTAILDFDQSGKRVSKQFCRSVIKSHKRFTYTLVRQILIDHDKKAVSENAEFTEMINASSDLATALLQRRMDRGSIGFSIPEPEIDLDEAGKISAIRRAERHFAHQIIEEFMLAANEAVAETFTKNKRKCLYRIHELPDYEKVLEFSIFAKTLDLQLPPPEISPEWFGKVLTLCKGTPKEYIVNNLLLRTMQQARYSTDNTGHFALATSDYTHFTSPIRRYPDLIVHRELCRMLLERQKSILIERKNTTDTFEQGVFLSARERVAVTSEREMNDRLKLIYMEKHLNEPFQAIISGVTEFACFVELLDLFISGAMPLESFKDEYYLYDGKHHRVVGEISGKVFQMGDIVTVCATDIEKNKNRVNFALCSVQ